MADLWQNPDAEILCRGWDCAMQRQPEKLVWNVMGMMNNSCATRRGSDARA